MPSAPRLTLALTLLAVPFGTAAADETAKEKAALEERQRLLKGMGDPVPPRPVLDGLPDLPAPDAGPANAEKPPAPRKHKGKSSKPAP